MSADNSILVANFKNQYRVIHTGAADNLTYDCDSYDGEYNYDEVYRVFKNAKRFYGEDAAYDYAHELEEHFGYIEYGISQLDFDCAWEEVFDKCLYEEDENDFDY